MTGRLLILIGVVLVVIGLVLNHLPGAVSGFSGTTGLHLEIETDRHCSELLNRWCMLVEKDKR